MSATRQQIAFDYFVAMGWTPAQSAGIVANLVAESGLNEAAVGDGGAAYGIAQWHPDRQENFRAIIGRDIRGSTIADQLAFVHAELNGTEKAAGDALRACTEAGVAGACVSVRYERPADRYGEAAKRSKLAEAILATAQNGAGATIPSPPTTQQQETTMGAALFLPAILQMIPSLIGIVGKGSPQATSNQAAVQTIVDTFTKAVPTAVNTQQAVEMAQADPTVKAQAVNTVLSDSTIKGMLDAVAPLLDKISQYDQQEWRAGIAGKDAAQARGAKDKEDIAPLLAWSSVLLVSVILLALSVILGLQMYWTADHKPDTTLIALIGPLLGVAFKVYSELFAYRFDGTPKSNATELGRMLVTNAAPKP